MNHKAKTLLLLTTVTTVSLHIINRIQYSISTKNNFLSDSESLEYEWRFGKIHYTKKGKGTPILLIHDLSVGSSEYEFKNLADELQKEHEVYTLDLLGYGLSDKPNMTYTNFLYVQLVTEFIKNVIGKKTNIIASGDSSSIAVMTTHNDGNIINNLVLINPQNLYQSNQIPSKQTKALKLFIEMPVFGTFLYNLLTTKGNIESTFENKYFANSNNIEKTDILTYWESAHKKGYCSKYSFASHTARYMNINIVHALKEINNSILIVGGANKDGIETTVENYIYYNNAIETAYIKSTKQLPHMEAPEEVLSHIVTFLS